MSRLILVCRLVRCSHIRCDAHQIQPVDVFNSQQPVRQICYWLLFMVFSWLIIVCTDNRYHKQMLLDPWFSFSIRTATLLVVVGPWTSCFVRHQSGALFSNTAILSGAGMSGAKENTLGQSTSQSVLGPVKDLVEELAANWEKRFKSLSGLLKPSVLVQGSDEETLAKQLKGLMARMMFFICMKTGN